MSEEQISEPELVSNYYEFLVSEEISRRGIADSFGQATMLDVLCTALNRLPAKYVRHPINLLFYCDRHDRDVMEQNAREAVDYALQQVEKRQ